MAKTESITERKLKKAITGSYGIIGNVAKKAGCSTRTVSRKLKRYPKLRELLEEEKAQLRSDMNDLADMVLFDALQNMDRKVAMWVKERLGANEGYNPALKLESTKDTNITLNFIDKEGADFGKEMTNESES